jgi:hypothetical protein
MKVTYLATNMAFAVTMGGQIVTLQDGIGPIGAIFDSLDKLDDALAMCGLSRIGEFIYS